MTYQTERTITLDSEPLRNWLKGYRDPKGWRSMAFLFLSFPLGILYFVALVTGISLGAGLSVTLVGLPILLAVFYASGWAVQFEAWLANRVLGADVQPTVYEYPEAKGLLAKVSAALRDGKRWRGMAWLLLRFPLGIISFVFAVIATSIPLAMMTAPFTFATGELSIAFWTINTLGEALLASVLGLMLGVVSLKAMRFATGVWRGLAEWALQFDDAPKAKNDTKLKNDRLRQMIDAELNDDTDIDTAHDTQSA